MAGFNSALLVRCIRELAARARGQTLPGSRLGSKFLAIISATLLFGVVLSSALILFLQHRQIPQSTRAYTEHIGIVVQASLDHAMLSDDKGMLEQMLHAIALESGLRRVSILDMQGRVWLSSTPVDSSHRRSEIHLACSVCHPSDAAVNARSSRPADQISGDTLYTVLGLPNKSACAQCHSASTPTLGLLAIETPIANFQDQVISDFWQLLISTCLIFLLLAGLVTRAVGHWVVQPVIQLARGAQEIGAGNLDIISPVRSNDEVGELAHAFDTMRGQLKIALVEKERRNRELQMLNEIACATNQLLDPQQILDLTIDVAVSSLGVQAGAIYLLDPEFGRFALHSCYGMPECKEVACHLWKFNKVLAGLNQPDSRVVSVPIADAGSSPSPKEKSEFSAADAGSALWRDGHGRSFVGVPLKAQGILLGAMTLVTHPGQKVTEEGAKILSAMGDQVGLALAHAIRFQNARTAATLEERERLAREMHDSLAQALGYIKLQTLLADDLLSKGQIAQAQANLRQVKEVAKETYTDLREAIFGLRHEPSPVVGFRQALEEYLSEYRAHYGLQVQLRMDSDCQPTFSDRVHLQLTRIVQEALTNIRKHAQTNQARLAIDQADHHWRITIEDDGRGFDPQAVPAGSQQFLGLHIMRERAASIGGRLELDSRPGGGTSLVLYIPVSEK